MYGAILGDIVGSRFEFHPIKTKEFTFLTDICGFTDDTVMTIAIVKTLLDFKHDNTKSLSSYAIINMQKYGRAYDDAGFGSWFYEWLFIDNPKPNNSFGNGAAMRIAPVGYVANSIEQLEKMVKDVTIVSHNNVEAIRGASAIACCVYLAKNKKSKQQIKQTIEQRYKYDLDFKLDDIRPTYDFDVSCQGSVPQAIVAFLESDSLIDAIRNAVSLGGDSDTIACMAGAIAEAYYGISNELIKKIDSYLPQDFSNLLKEMYNNYELS